MISSSAKSGVSMEVFRHALFDGLYNFGRSVGRLRVLAPGDASRRIVLATHLSDAPGASIINGLEAPG
jgi:hypothetical protein